MRAYQTLQFDALGDSTRRAVLEQLRSGRRSVGDLARVLPVSRPAVSQHLRVLKDAHLVQDKASGTKRYYELDPRGFASLRAYLDGFWGEALQAFKEKVEER